MEKITKALQWTELEYYTFIHETGIAYLHAYIPMDAQGIDQLNRSKIFWNWWKNHWQLRDQDFIEIMEPTAPVKALRNLYLNIHSVKALTGSIYPNATVLHQSYAVMIDHFHNDKTEQI